MAAKKGLKGYQGMFFNEETQEKLVNLQKKGLSDIAKDMHITFKFGKTEQYPEELMGKEITVKIVGYASDGKNSGFQVELPEELKQYYQNQNSPHITVSLGEIDGVKGKPIDTGTMNFEAIEEPIEIQGQLGYFVYGKGKVIDNSIFKEENKMEEKNQEVNVIDIEKLAQQLGKEKTQLPNGRMAYNWKQEELLDATRAVKGLAGEGRPVVITGGAPAWLVSALTHAVHPCQVSLFDPKLNKNVPIPGLNMGATNEKGGLNFKVTTKGESSVIEYSIADEDGIYDYEDLPSIVVPEIKGKEVYLTGRAPNYVTVAIAEAYAHVAPNVSLNQPGIGYTCSITHTKAKKLGDVIKDPLGKEEIKEQLSASKSKIEKEGQSIDE